MDNPSEVSMRLAHRLHYGHGMLTVLMDQEAEEVIKDAACALDTAGVGEAVNLLELVVKYAPTKKPMVAPDNVGDLVHWNMATFIRGALALLKREE